MSLQIEPTRMACAFCKQRGETNLLTRSIHGLYCSNDQCYTRSASGNLVPPVECPACKENAFYLEESSPPQSVYICIACGNRESTD